VVPYRVIPLTLRALAAAIARVVTSDTTVGMLIPRLPRFPLNAFREVSGEEGELDCDADPYEDGDVVALALAI
jgi:hypothetical protein